MIISHQHRFIYLKTRKTAGTSVEIALSQFCGPDDVITPITAEDEALRAKLGFRGPQNYQFSKPTSKDSAASPELAISFSNHCPASRVRKWVDSDVWQSYFKFCIERNPYDKAISRYFWSTSEPRPTIAECMNEIPIEWLSNWSIYTIHDHLAIDQVAKYENLQQDLNQICKRLGLTDELELPRAKGGYRKDRQHYSQLLDKEARRRIEVVCAKELRYFEYEWEHARPQ